jgi:hypothetical protein
MDAILVVAIVVIFGGSLVGIFWTKTKGFGKYTTSTVILTLVLFVTSIAFATQRIDSEVLANILFAIAGFAGGLITSKSGQN